MEYKHTIETLEKKTHGYHQCRVWENRVKYSRLTHTENLFLPEDPLYSFSVCWSLPGLEQFTPTHTLPTTNPSGSWEIKLVNTKTVMCCLVALAYLGLCAWYSHFNRSKMLQIDVMIPLILSVYVVQALFLSTCPRPFVCVCTCIFVSSASKLGWSVILFKNILHLFQSSTFYSIYRLFFID